VKKYLYHARAHAGQSLENRHHVGCQQQQQQQQQQTSSSHPKLTA